MCVAQQREGKSTHTHTHTQTHKHDHVHRARGTSPPPHPAWACLCVFVCGACVVFETNFKCCAGVFECMSCLCMLVCVRWHLLCPPVVSFVSVRMCVGVCVACVAFVRLRVFRCVRVCASVCLRVVSVCTFVCVPGGVVACIYVCLCVLVIARA